MPDSLTISGGALCAFLLVLARVAGALSFVPLPGIKGIPEPARAALAVALTLALFPRWPAVDAGAVTAAGLAGWALAEATVGLAIGVSMSFVLEAFTVAAQIAGLQAGYAYASTVDPNTEADSGVLLVFAQLMASALFFALGLDREVLRLFARSLDAIPLGAYGMSRASAKPIVELSAGLFTVGMRLALPVVALLVMVDVALALLGRLNQQLQLLSLAFPAKMLIALLALSWLAVLYPRIMTEFGGQACAAARRILGL
jgi:flagellar biosynthetic protein FliR